MIRTGISTAAGVAVLLGVLAAGVAVAVAVLGADAAQLRAIAFAAGMAGLAAVAGWCMGRWGRGRAAGLAVAGGLAATLVRLLPVLVALGWILTHREGVGAGRADMLLVVFYLVLLATDVLLNMMGGHEPPLDRRGTTSN